MSDFLAHVKKVFMDDMRDSVAPFVAFYKWVQHESKR
jgi:hypothetical protein